MMTKATVPVAILLGLCPTEALAIEGKLLAPDGVDVVHVWKDQPAYDSAQNLYAIGIPAGNPEVITNLATCTVEPDTRAITRRIDYAITEIRVIEGPEAGCTGVVPNAQFQAR